MVQIQAKVRRRCPRRERARVGVEELASRLARGLDLWTGESMNEADVNGWLSLQASEWRDGLRAAAS